MTAGTSSSRTMVASMSTLTARPRPSILTTMLSLTMNAAKTLTMMSAAQLMTRAVISSACATLALVSNNGICVGTHHGHAFRFALDSVRGWRRQRG